MSTISRDSCANHVYFSRRSLVDHDCHVVGLLAMIDAVMDVRQVETELTCSAGGGHPIQKGIRFTDNRASKIF